MRTGYDSSTPPTEAQLKLALSRGVTFWGGYVGGAGSRDANAAWSKPGAIQSIISVMDFMPIWLPALDLSEDPEQQADQCVARIKGLGLTGVAYLDTEASMRNNGRLRSWVSDWNAAIIYDHDWESVIYNGALYLPPCSYEWVPNLNHTPGEYQAYQGAQDDCGGLEVDVDICGSGFPFPKRILKNLDSLSGLLTTTTKEYPGMFYIVHNNDTQQEVLATGGGVVYDLINPTNAQAWAAAGCPIVNVDAAFWAEIVKTPAA